MGEVEPIGAKVHAEVLNSKDFILSVTLHCMMGSVIKVGLVSCLGFPEEEQETYCRFKKKCELEDAEVGKCTKFL